MIGRVEGYLIDKIKKRGVIHLTLIDPIKVDEGTAVSMAKTAEKSGSTAVMIGGSIGVEQSSLDRIIKSMKKEVEIPVILFPGSVSGLSRYADAVLFMSLLNSLNPYYIIQAQMTGAPIIKKYNLEPIPLAYIIFEPGEAAGYVGQAKLIPRHKKEIAAAFALAAQYLGMRFVYLESGSGAPSPLPAETIAAVKKTVNIPVIVGGGVRSKEDFAMVAKAGADAIVTGTLTEMEKNVRSKLSKFISEAEKVKKSSLLG